MAETTEDLTEEERVILAAAERIPHYGESLTDEQRKGAALLGIPERAAGAIRYWLRFSDSFITTTDHEAALAAERARSQGLEEALRPFVDAYRAAGYTFVPDSIPLYAFEAARAALSTAPEAVEDPSEALINQEFGMSGG